jgi:hypothetical protein
MRWSVVKSMLIFVYSQAAVKDIFRSDASDSRRAFAEWSSAELPVRREDFLVRWTVN